MTTVHPHPDTDLAEVHATVDLGGPPRFRHVLGAVCMPLLVVALLATGPLDPFDDSAKASVQLTQLPGHLVEVRVLGYVELLAAFLFGAVVLAFAGHTRARGRGVANAGVVFGILGVMGMALVAVHHWILVSVGTLAHADGVKVVDRLDTVAGPAILPMMMSAPIALLLFAIAGHRAGFVPLPAFLLSIAWFVGELVPVLPGGELVPLVLELVAMSWIAVTLIRPASATSD
jgi:hypothetical protein